MNKSRRDFLKKLPLAMSIPFTIGGIPIKLMADNPLTQMALGSIDNDRVLIILQLAGGNDGLNTLIPVQDYDTYYNRRANIAIPAKNNVRGYIPLDDTLPDAAKVGLHPDMLDMKHLYDIGRLGIVQGVSYKNNNGSHFRGRDIWFMGGSADDYFQSGWVGRYFDEEYSKQVPPLHYPENFPNDAMEDPLAIEMGNELSLIFHQMGNIPTSISIDSSLTEDFDLSDLEGFVDLDVDPRGLPPSYLAGSPYYKELDWILSLEDKTKDYAERLLEVYNAGGTSSITYPEIYPLNAPEGSKRNPLTPQLRLIARMLRGGCKTKVFLAKIGGFDTHADQVEKYDPTMGAHAALMYHISSAMRAFQEDLRQSGLEDRVLTVTTSEFGRRINSNGSFGTDHGTGGPLFIFGKGVKPGVTGVSPEAVRNSSEGNVEKQYDYREVYAGIMKHWMLVDDATLDVVFPGIISTGMVDDLPFRDLPLANEVVTGVGEFISDRFALEDCYPNPARDKTTLLFRINTANRVVISLMDSNGKQLRALVDADYAPGEHRVEVRLEGLMAGAYIYQLKSGFFSDSKKLVIVK